MYAKKEKIYPAYVSKHNSNHEKQVILYWFQTDISCGKKSNSIIKRNTFQTSWWFLWSRFPIILLQQKKIESHKKYVKIKIFIM